jgi:hypothetical protein
MGPVNTGRTIPAWSIRQSCRQAERRAHKTSIVAETILDGESEALTRRCIETALAGHYSAMRLVMERILLNTSGRKHQLRLSYWDRIDRSHEIPHSPRLGIRQHPAAACGCRIQRIQCPILWTDAGRESRRRAAVR